MAIDPRISLAASTRDVITPALNMFENTLNARSNRAAQQQNIAQSQQQMNQLEIMNPLLAQEGQQNIDINNQTIAAGEMQAAQNRSVARLTDLNRTGQGLSAFLEPGKENAVGAKNFMLNNYARLQNAKAEGKDVDFTETLETLNAIENGKFDEVRGNIQSVSNMMATYNTGGSSTKSYAPVVDPVSGKLSIPTANGANRG